MTEPKEESVPEVREIHIEGRLTGLAEAYSHMGCIGNGLCPTVKVAKPSDLYTVFGREELFVTTDVLGDRDEANEVEWHTADLPFQTVPRGLRSFISSRQKKASDPPIQIETTTTKKLIRAMDLMKELRVKALADATVATTSQDSGDKSDAWATAATGTPVTDILDAKYAFINATGMKPNRIVIPDHIIPDMVLCAEWLAYFQPTHPDLIQKLDGLPPDIFGMTPMVPSQRYAAEAIASMEDPTTAPTLANVWGDHVYLAYVNPRPSLFESSWAYDLTFTKRRVRRIAEPKLGIGGGEWIQVEQETVEKEVNQYCLYRIQNVI